MKSYLSKAGPRRLIVALAMLGTLSLNPDAPACPQDSPIQRAGSGPYASVWDYRITNAPGTETQGYDPSGGKNASLALSITGIIAVAYEREDPDNSSGNALSLQRFNVNFPFPGGCICDQEPDPPFDFIDDCPFRLDDAPTDGTIFSHVSLAIAREGENQHQAGKVFATWLSKPPGQTPSRVMLPFAYHLRETPIPDDNLFSRADPDIGPAPASSGGNDDFGPSAAIQPTRESVGLTSRLRTPANERRGLIHESQLSSSVAEDRFRCCDDGGSCANAPLDTCAVQFQEWLPCARARRDGLTCVVWSEREQADSLTSAFNIALRLYDSDGVLLAQIDRESPLYKSVNQPNLEIEDSNQRSPAVDLDQCGNIIVTWIGPDPLDTTTCGSSAGGLRVFGRRLAYQNGTLFFRDNQFVVNVDPDWIVGPDPDLVNPSVALHLKDDGGFAGKFFIAWNAKRTFTEQPEEPHEFDQWGVRGRFFTASGLFRTPEFDVTPNEPDGHDRTLAESAQHTIAYWSKDAAFAAWTEHDEGAEVIDHVWYTAFDIGFIFSIDQTVNCIKGDVNGDTVVDFADVGPFIDYLLTEQILCDAIDPIRCAVDTNRDGETNGLDVHCLTALITGGDLDACFRPLVADCAASGLGGGGEGGGESMMAGGGSGGGGEGEGDSDGGANQPEHVPTPLDGLSEAEIEARWTTFTEFLDSHPQENYPDWTEEAYCEMLGEAFVDIMYEGETLDW